LPTITCFDGVKCIGGNKILLENDGGKLFFDFGKNFGEEGALYNEYMQPKAVAGLYEHVQMGFLPPFSDLYRADLVSALWDPWNGLETSEIGDVGGVLVSHAHVDHIGSIGFLRPDIPVYSSTVTAAVSKALQDTGQSSLAGESCYCVGRVENDDGGLKSPPYKTHPYTGRPYRVVGEQIKPGFSGFWSTPSGSRDLEAHNIEPTSTCAGMSVKSWPVDHSVYGAASWAVETDAGWVVYTGDVRTHGIYGSFTRQFAEEAAKLNPVALIIEGTRITSDSVKTEQEVLEHSLKAVEQCSGLVVADFGPRNVERLLSFLDIAKQTGRELAILAKDAYMIDALHAADGDQTVPPLENSGFKIYWKESGSSFKWQKNMRERYGHLTVGPKDIAANQDKFICCFSYYDVNELAYIRPAPGSIYIFSSCEAFNEEMELDAEKLRLWINKLGLTVYGKITEKDEEQSKDPFHVSGHASRTDLMNLVRTIRPKTLIPVHTEHPEDYVEEIGDICEVRLPTRSEPIQL